VVTRLDSCKHFPDSLALSFVVLLLFNVSTLSCVLALLNFAQRGRPLATLDGKSSPLLFVLRFLSEPEGNDYRYYQFCLKKAKEAESFVAPVPLRVFVPSLPLLPPCKPHLSPLLSPLTHTHPYTHTSGVDACACASSHNTPSPDPPSLGTGCEPLPRRHPPRAIRLESTASQRSRGYVSLTASQSTETASHGSKDSIIRHRDSIALLTIDSITIDSITQHRDISTQQHTAS
jgi:hypothetical protein